MTAWTALFAAAAAASFAGASPVGAVPSAGDSGAALQAVKSAAANAVSVRVTSLNQTVGVITASSAMGPDKVTLTTAMNSDIASLQQLNATVEADTTAAAARADAAKVFTEFRIYALVLPAAHMVRAADLINDAVVPKLTAAADKLQTAITQRGATTLQPTLNDMTAQIAAAVQATSGLASQLEGLTAAQWNTNHALLAPARASLDTARADLRKARQDAKAIVAGVAHQ